MTGNRIFVTRVSASGGKMQKAKEVGNVGIRPVDHQLDIHGVQELLRVSDTFTKRKFFWFSVIVFSTALCGISCYNVTFEYYHNATATRIELKQAKVLGLPRLVICSTHAAGFQGAKLMAYLQNRFPNTSEDVLERFPLYIAAGSAFQKMDDFVEELNQSQIDQFDQMYRQLRGDLTVLQFFHQFFDQFGIHCSQMFHKCRLGYANYLNCCKIFQPNYVFRRGRCFSLIPLNQTKNDDLGKMTLYLNYPTKLMHQDMHPYKDIIMYVSEHGSEDVAPFPQYYIYRNKFSKIRMNAFRVLLLHDDPNKCLPVQLYSTNTCYLNASVGHSHRLLQCTPPYWPTQPNVPPLPICEPKKIAENYKAMVKIKDRNDSGVPTCLLPCQRWQYSITFEEQQSKWDFEPRGYTQRLEVAYHSLQYTVIREVRTVTFWGLVSQIGGQMGLFLGSSIISVFQLTILIVFLLKNTISNAVKKWMVSQKI